MKHDIKKHISVFRELSAKRPDIRASTKVTQNKKRPGGISRRSGTIFEFADKVSARRITERSDKAGRESSHIRDVIEGLFSSPNHRRI